MKRPAFKLWHSLAATAALLVVEALLLHIMPHKAPADALILLASLLGAAINIYVATEVVEEVKGSRHMYILLIVVIAQFIAFFAFEYWFLRLAEPASFPTLATDALTLLLNSTMVFLFNPISLPATATGRALMLIDTFGGLGLALFVLQNIGQLRRKSLDE